MGCRVGMSATPNERIAYWKRQEGHTHGRILACGLTYDGALRRETLEAQKRSCKSSPGGKRKPGRVWSVYHVWGGIVR